MNRDPQLIQIAPCGAVRSLQVKRGQGIDLRSLGPASIVRSSLIEWNESRQQWEVIFQTGLLAGKPLTHGMCSDVGLHLPTPKRAGDFYPACRDEVAGFEDYEDAVVAEVRFIQATRRAGQEVVA